MSQSPAISFFEELYQGFPSALSEIDCGLKCGPHNDRGVPVCCDIRLTIPSAYESEWEFLQERTDLWRPWSSSNDPDNPFEDEIQDGQVLLQCQGHEKCQRPYRTLTCRAFPFFPYLDSRGDFLGLAYYPDYRESCWMISNLELVTNQYRREFRQAYLEIFTRFPTSREIFARYAAFVRTETASQGEQITVLDFADGVFLVDPDSEEITPIDYSDLQAYGVFAVTREMQFPDEKQV